MYLPFPRFNPSPSRVWLFVCSYVEQWYASFRIGQLDELLSIFTTDDSVTRREAYFPHRRGYTLLLHSPSIYEDD
ncbi:hypothetical protein LENED_010006 [Lentinula edodes]|uniref:Uncharacterized protein n=1 Tax=Lentinula edodes TaxID=5353 RepID=A0A1Q3ELA4_LENED|nr:hypothetical protein LENED_010006 [Lentinula edodes]